jgi:tyrosyl-tRNA synthetase
MSKMTPKMTLSEELAWRGFINQATFKDLKELDGKKWTFYHGFDASASSQTVGNLAAMMFDKVFMRHGCNAILLAGGATSQIGDPGGKDEERVLQSEEVIAGNIKQAEKQMKIVFKDQTFRLVNNLDWTKDMKVIPFLRDIGKHFSMTPLVQRDYIAKRIGEGGAGISYTEFSYTLLQGMDFLHLYDTYDCTLQLGGSDQWGNCLSGVDLIRRARGAVAHAITLPLIINKSTGKKFGKSEEGAIWLDAKLTSPYKFYQFWLNIDDEGVEYYLKIYTELDKPTIDDVMKRFNEDRSIRLAQKTLAFEVTALLHGKEIAESVKRVSKVLFGGDDYKQLTAADFSVIKEELGSVKANAGASLTDLLVEAKLASSKGEARRFLSSKAVYINGQQVDDSKQSLEASDAIKGHVILRRGKNSQVVIEL